MRTYLECFPCFLSQTIRAGRMATSDEEKLKKLVDEVGMMLKDIPMHSPPPATARIIYRKIKHVTGNPDPYKKIKEQSTRTALALYPSMKEEIERSKDGLLTAIRLAIAGNVIDLGINRSFDVEEEIRKALENDFAVCHYDTFRAKLRQAEEILYLGDNAGECVFDRLLIEEMAKPVTYVVRGEPVINDAVHEDAVQAGLGKIATIVSSGTDAPGTILETCTTEFRKMYADAGLIISKGQGNYETLSGENRPIFFMLKVKCPVVARDIGIPEGGMILKTGAA